MTIEEPTTKNDSAVDCISRADLYNRIKNINYGEDYECDEYGGNKIIYRTCDLDEVLREIKYAPSVTPQEPRCKDCKWWKDSDGKYRRGCGAESQCPINNNDVYCGDGYCYMFSPKVDMREVEE